MTGRHREAAGKLEDLLQWVEPSADMFWSLGVTWLVAVEPATALGYFEQGGTGANELGRVLALHDLGRQEEFAAAFEAIKADSQWSPESIARIAAWTGQNDLAFEYLEHMVDESGPAAAAGVDSDLYEPIKSDPRWPLFLERNGVIEEDLSHIQFNPLLPPEVVEEVKRVRAERERNNDES